SPALRSPTNWKSRTTTRRSNPKAPIGEPVRAPAGNLVRLRILALGAGNGGFNSGCSDYGSDTFLPWIVRADRPGYSDRRFPASGYLGFHQNGPPAEAERSRQRRDR